MREYPSDFRSRIGFQSVLDEIAAKVQTLGGGELLENIEFSSNFSVVERRAGEVAEMVSLLRSVDGSDFERRGYVDLAPLLSKVRVVGGYMEASEMNVLSSGVELASSVVSFLCAEKRVGEYPLLSEMALGVMRCEEVSVEARRIVDKFGKVRDNASPALASIRRELASKGGQISKRLQQIMTQAKSDGYVDSDAQLSIRDGRAVIPVAAGHKRKIKGFVFDESATGRTAYIEPLEVIELNNELRELHSAERFEVVKILIDFANFLRPRIEELGELGEFLCYVDFLLAKALYAEQSRGALPLLTDKAEVELKNARHPLLDKVFRSEGRASELIPLDIRLTAQKPILLISGPNAGGKSVCLKTVGLLQYMLQCGVLPPVSENSEMGIFSKIFIDIGDQQSIDDDLSTYSSHLTNMKVMLREADESSLVLIDEFGGGTEPSVGGAIAEAILTEFTEKKVVGVITTHYANLKYFAASHSGIENGAMTFDAQRIKPLYRLEMGVAGNSYAFEIARKIGLSESVLKVASDIVGEDKMSLEKQLRDALRDKRYWENKRQNIRLANKSAEKMAGEYESELEEIKKERARLIKDAKREAERIVKEAGAVIEKTIREIKESQAERERTKVARSKVEEFRSQVEQKEVVDESIEKKIKQLREREERRSKRSKEREEKKSEAPVVKKVEVKVVEVGSTVQLDGLGVVGTVISINGKKATVAFGNMTSVVELRRLRVSMKSEGKIVPKTSKSVVSVASSNIERAMTFSQQLDVRGLRVDEAMERVQSFVDDAIVLGSRRVTILHGKGTGALKEEIRRYLRSEPAVSRAYDEHVELGGAGITVVEF
ncbi:MAG: Smr/MutS family protein [Rikenellaceae bacterium]